MSKRTVYGFVDNVFVNQIVIMSLPSKYAPEGLGKRDQKRTITTGKKHDGPVNYSIRHIESKIDQAIKNSSIKDEDIEMIPMDNSDEVDVISQYVLESRTTGLLLRDTSDDMELDKFQVHSETVALEGNISYLIVDTNFILSHLDTLDALKNIGAKYGLRIVIPSMTVHELDGLKNSDRIEKNGNGLSTKSVGNLARWANDWIYSCLAKRVPTVVAQKKDQRLDRLATKDDAILDCCLYFQKEYPKTLEVLMSNDKNLCMKALLNDVLTISYRNKMSAEIIAETVRLENLHRFGHIEVNLTTIKEKPVAIVQTTDKTVYETVYGEVQKLVLSVVHHCMSSSYGEDLDLIRNYNKDGIVSLHDASTVITRFWQPVFSAYLGYKSKFKESAGGMVDRPSSPKQLREFVEFWGNLLHLLYTKELDAHQNKALSLLVQRWDALAASA